MAVVSSTTAWQVRPGEHDLTVLLAGAGPGVDMAAVDQSVRVALAAAGARCRSPSRWWTTTAEIKPSWDLPVRQGQDEPVRIN
jgi:hypothetical protein